MARDGKPRIEVDEVDPNIVWQIWPDGSRRRFHPRRSRSQPYRGFKTWLNTRTGETFWGIWPPPWIEEKDKRRRPRGPGAITRGFLKRIF